MLFPGLAATEAAALLLDEVAACALAPSTCAEAVAQIWGKAPAMRPRWGRMRSPMTCRRGGGGRVLG